ncbi:MAG: XrtA system polysaccharide deacetylase [Immundisolibacter sp.]|uniref:XrtA system polysaccharide deacetylase n=1 Tax=Immundisolibacter sp. TaxID=1934948 RepID=UPI003EE35C49
MQHVFSVDVEEHFQVAALASRVSKAAWASHPSRVEANTERCLDILDVASAKGTFFVLGWVARRCPKLIGRIVARGHELASHGMAHDRVTDLGAKAFSQDIQEARDVLQDLGGVSVDGYRAPSFSLRPEMDWAYAALIEAGYRYSSSVYPVRHDHYGAPDAPRQAYRPLADARFVELPMTTARVARMNVPASGGGYFRLLPYALSRRLLRRVQERDKTACVFYMHPWEIDSEQPRVAGLPWRSRFRHYINLHRTESRLKALLNDFSWARMDQVFSREIAQPENLPLIAQVRR